MRKFEDFYALFGEKCIKIEFVSDVFRLESFLLYIEQFCLFCQVVEQTFGTVLTSIVDVLGKKQVAAVLPFG